MKKMQINDVSRFTSSFVSLCVLTLVFGACAHPPKVGGDSTLQSLNGENYQAPLVGYPFALREGSTNTVIKGQLLIGDGTAIPQPLKYQKLVLTLDKKEVARAMSNAGGAFMFTGEIPNSDYIIRLDSTKYEVEQKLRVTEYKLDGVQVVATLKNEP